MTNGVNSGWFGVVVVGQTEPVAAGVPQASAPAAAAPVAQPVGVPGAVTPATTGTAAAPAGGAASPGMFGGNFMLIVIPLIAVMWLTSMFAGKKDKKKRAELMDGIKRQDKVQMIGGIIGTVVETTDTEVVLRVEEGRIRFSKSAVQNVITPAKAKTENSLAEVKGEKNAVSV